MGFLHKLFCQDICCNRLKENSNDYSIVKFGFEIMPASMANKQFLILVRYKCYPLIVVSPTSGSKT